MRDKYNTSVWPEGQSDAEFIEHTNLVLVCLGGISLPIKILENMKSMVHSGVLEVSSKK